MTEFRRYHPIVNFTYFLFAIIFTCMYLHPVMLAISTVVAFVHSVMLKGTGMIKKNLMYMLPAVLIMALINPAFNHEGVTILAYLPSGNPLTVESIFYGIVSAMMIISMILHFMCFNEVMTSDKFIYLFGRVIPSLSLIFSMTLRFVPKFINQFKAVANAQKCVGRDISDGSIISRAKSALSVLSIVVTWSLENAIETSDSMKSRGYGLSGRTAFSIYTFSKRDLKALVCILFLAVYVIAGGIMGEISFACYPSIQLAKFSIYGLSVFIAYLILVSLPIIIGIGEVRKWEAIKSKM
ncbi:MAG: energy-coupling factor transporter transmembrane protein EcfT [Clostridia bacterium]|nr:energy-coupling factor transporter transmembrane protein EcfT [Clostridia bacterium]